MANQCWTDARGEVPQEPRAKQALEGLAGRSGPARVDRGRGRLLRGLWRRFGGRLYRFSPTSPHGTGNGPNSHQASVCIHDRAPFPLWITPPRNNDYRYFVISIVSILFTMKSLPSADSLQCFEAAA